MDESQERSPLWRRIISALWIISARESLVRNNKTCLDAGHGVSGWRVWSILTQAGSRHEAGRQTDKTDANERLLPCLCVWVWVQRQKLILHKRVLQASSHSREYPWQTNSSTPSIRVSVSCAASRHRIINVQISKQFANAMH